MGGFVGLALALEITGESANALGVGLAALASVLMAATALLSARVLKTDNARSVTLHMHISAAALFVLVSIVVGDLSLPQTTRGWVGYIGVPLFYTVAVATFFAGIAHIGAVRASLVMNLEPRRQHRARLHPAGAGAVTAPVAGRRDRDRRGNRHQVAGRQKQIELRPV